MKKIVFIILFLAEATSVNAQNEYKTAVGLRFGPNTGFDVKHNLDESTSIEGIVNFQWHGLLVMGLYEKNFPVIKQVDGFRFYMGAGAHVGFWSDYSKHHPWYEEDDTRNHVAIGVDGIIGLEYTFKDIPLNLAIDWIPMINFADHAAFYAGGVGLSVRYAIK